MRALKTDDKVKYIADIHPAYTGQKARVIDFDLEIGMAGIRFADGMRLKVYWDEIVPVIDTQEDTGIGTVEMIRDDDGHYIPLECCTMTNPATSGGVGQIDDIDLPCGLECGRDCNECVIQRIMDEYGELTRR